MEFSFLKVVGVIFFYFFFKWFFRILIIAFIGKLGVELKKNKEKNKK